MCGSFKGAGEDIWVAVLQRGAMIFWGAVLSGWVRIFGWLFYQRVGEDIRVAVLAQGAKVFV